MSPDDIPDARAKTLLQNYQECRRRNESCTKVFVALIYGAILTFFLTADSGNAWVLFLLGGMSVAAGFVIHVCTLASAAIARRRRR